MGREFPRTMVLVVEDEAVIRLSAMSLVEAAGFEAISASNAEDALSALEQHDDICLVFTDIQMPGSMDGLDLIRVVRERWPCVAALVTSGKSCTPFELPTGVTFLGKPYMSDQFEAALRKLLH